MKQIIGWELRREHYFYESLPSCRSVPISLLDVWRVRHYFPTHQQFARGSKDKTLQCFWGMRDMIQSAVCFPQTEHPAR
jgi:hypothetical protein